MSPRETSVDPSATEGPQPENHPSTKDDSPRGENNDPNGALTEEQPRNPFNVEKKFQFGMPVRPKQLFDALYLRDINAPWEVAKEQIMENIRQFILGRNRKIDEIEMERISIILESSDREFKYPAENNDQYPHGNLTWGINKLQEAIADELNKRK